MLFGIVAVFGSPYNNTNGKPACNAEERAQEKWPNNFDPTKYWYCAPAPSSAAAVEESCPPENAFDVGKLECVPWAEWTWTPYENPPSQQ